MLEVKWTDGDVDGVTNIQIHHHMNGLSLKLFMYMLEIQLIHGEEDIIVRAFSDSTYYGEIVYHFTPQQARKVWQSFDGFSYDAEVEFDSQGILWKDYLKMAGNQALRIKGQQP